MKPSIPQFCCATCTHWGQIAVLGAVGRCARNFMEPAAGYPVPAQTLDLQLCTKWEKSDTAEDVMYGKRG